MTQQDIECPFCGGKATKSSVTDNINYKFFECETCGRYEMKYFGREYETNKINKDKLASYLYYNRKKDTQNNIELGFNFIGEKEQFEKEIEKLEKEKIETGNVHFVTNDEIEGWYPDTFSEKVDAFLLGAAEKSNYPGDIVSYPKYDLRSACFVTRANEEAIQVQQQYFVDFLLSKKYIDYGTEKILIKPDGWQRIEELQKNRKQNSKTVFVAMSFAPEMNEVKEAIRQAVEQAGYIPRIMNEIEHNHQIVPEMLHEIRQARFLIAELTNHNNGAYFEAGYALGLCKEVIQVCKKDAFENDGHFDVKQINTILWESYDDLRDGLCKRIKATIE